MASGLTAVVTRRDGEARDDLVATEAPLELVVDDVQFVVLMRTPTGSDDDLALAAGFLWSEGVIADADDLAALAPCRDPASAQRDHRVIARLAAGVPARPPRPVMATSACGICGAASIADIMPRLPPRLPNVARRPLDAAEIAPLGELARPHQPLFSATGAVHGAALFRGTTLIDLKEDVGRHNAVDKLLGRALLDGRPRDDLTLWVSGRVAFEIVQKAAIAGVRALVGVGGPTSLAVELARAVGLPLVAFARADRSNDYAP